MSGPGESSDAQIPITVFNSSRSPRISPRLITVAVLAIGAVVAGVAIPFLPVYLVGLVALVSVGVVAVTGRRG